MQREGRKLKAHVRPMIRLIPPEPPRQLLFPSDEEPAGRGEPSLSPEPPSPISHVVRRRASSAPAYEVELEELEIFDESEDSRPLVPPAPPPLPPASVEAPWQPASLAPLVFDPPPIPVPLRDRTTSSSPARGQRAMATYGAIAMLVVGIAIGAMLRTDGLGIAETGGAVQRSEGALSTAATPVAEAPAPVPVVAVSSLPRASVGTVIGAEGHRLWVDGHLAESFTTVVACGRHVVKVGSAGIPKDVDVPCGDGITVLP